MPFSDEEIAEFKTEAEELLDGAEKCLMAVQRGEDFKGHYDAIFRVFHSLKGAAGMMEMPIVQSHMHQVETIFTEQKPKSVLDACYVSFFLRATDACRALLDNEAVEFEYTVSECATTLEKPSASVVSIRPNASPLKNSGRVLVVDDEPYIVEILREMLSDAGFEVCGICLPEEALGLIESYKPEVVLSDIAMPKISGHGLLRVIRETHPDLPVVFLSGHVDKDALLEGIEHGVYSVMEKPFDRTQVIETCLNAAKKYRLAKLVQRSINLLVYQFSDLDDFLVKEGKLDVRNSIRHELTSLLEQMREMRRAENPAGKKAS
ncbi:MAG: hybrid sensor histidine kinase/response regulator [Proteobacteria bacterium]|nr:MAG: hybrid sensor histidine kinase/response regulator [Pseudomonadota bacterium]